jgi:hypothetical protein
MKEHFGFLSEVWTMWKAVFLSQYVLGVIYFLNMMVIKTFDSEFEISMNDH